ncbi:MAG: toprim domain-containing protein, partial [Opitutaceae bacterium]
ACTARQLGLTPADEPAREAKYVNSPETPIFTKSNLLFNLDRARSHATDGHPFVLVEGQLDALRCWSVGLRTAIAPQGTSITEGQLALLRRYHPQVECFFDSDGAGQKAALRFLPMALKAGLEVRFLMLAGPEKMDPDLLFLERGLAAYDDVKKNSCSAMAFACQSLLPQAATASAEQKSRAATALYEMIAQTDSDVTRMSFLNEIAQNLRVPQAALERDLRAYLLRGSGSRFAPTNNSPTPAVNLSTGPSTKAAEAHLLFLCLHHESLLHAFASQLPHEWIDQSQPAGRLLDRILAEAAHNGWAGREQLDQILETEEEKSLIASLLFEIAGDDDLAKMANEGLRSMQRRFLEPKARQIELEIATKGADLDSELPSLLKQRAEIIRQLQHPPKLTLDS